MEQIAVFTNPSPMSTVTTNLQAKKARGGIKCILNSVPEEPKTTAVLKNGNWEEVSCSDHQSNTGSTFSIELDETDDATAHLLSALRKNKNIDELVVYELNTTDNKEQYAYYFSKVFVTRIQSGLEQNEGRFVWLVCKCMSFKQKNSNNLESVIWDWDTNSHKYTGQTR